MISASVRQVCISLVIASLACTTAKATGLVECIGHHTVTLPGAFEYSLPPNNRLAPDHFSDGLRPRDTHIDVRFDPGFARPVSVSQKASETTFQSMFADANAASQAKKNELLAWIQRQDADPSHAVDPTGEDRKLFKQRAELVPFYERVPGRSAFVWPGSDRTNVYVLMNDYVVSGQSGVDASPLERADRFASHFEPRAALEAPLSTEACIPSFTIRDGDLLDSIGVNMRMLDRPDIVIYFEEDDAAPGAQDPKQFLAGAMQPGRTFVDSVKSEPLNRLKPTHKITIAGRQGLGAFVEVKREGTSANLSHHDIDWAFIGYVPGSPGDRPKRSHSVVLKVERFGRFARSPMSEEEFRSLVTGLKEGIRQR